MISSKTGTVIRFVSALAILVYGAFMLFLGENSILDKLFVYFASFCLVFSELLSTKTYNLCDKEEKARIAIHAAASAAILILGIILLCLGIIQTAERNSIWRYIPLIIFGLDGVATLIVIAVFKRETSNNNNS